jgi:hypothetical protein
MDVNLDAAGLPSLPPPHDVLIGRDILAKYRIAIDFTTGAFCLHFKSGS